MRGICESTFKFKQLYAHNMLKVFFHVAVFEQITNAQKYYISYQNQHALHMLCMQSAWRFYCKDLFCFEL